MTKASHCKSFYAVYYKHYQKLLIDQLMNAERWEKFQEQVSRTKHEGVDGCGKDKGGFQGWKDIEM